MDQPGADSLVETVRRLNEMMRKARSGEPTVDDYLQAVASDPVTDWFTVLLREKTEELEKERARLNRLTLAGRHWLGDMGPRLSENACTQAELDLARALRDLGVIEP
jgi:hypothetical protein